MKLLVWIRRRIHWLRLLRVARKHNLKVGWRHNRPVISPELAEKLDCPFLEHENSL